MPIFTLITYSAIAVAAIIIYLALAAIGAAWGQPTPYEREDGGYHADK